MTKNIIFLHPDLGVGGAERLVVDAALALKGKGHQVSFVTSHYDKNHCFEETKNSDLKITVVGDWIPRNILGRFYAFFAYLKMIYCAFYILFFEKPDIVFCDLVSVCIPVLHISVKKIIYYCHYPDQLLSKEEGFLKRLYRIPLNWLEENTTNCADKIYVNSEFTKQVYNATFTTLQREPTVLYPSINTRSFDNVTDSDCVLPDKLNSDNFVFLSINRYERKKHIALAISALTQLKGMLSNSDWTRTVLVIAGGYDPRLNENVQYFNELKKFSNFHKVDDKVIFLKSPSDSDKVKLLRRCNCVIYTPPNEHFGIVPLEAMYCKKPVIACNSGGPKETIVNGKTGVLCDLTAEDFSNAMCRFIQHGDLAKKMGEEGYNRFVKKFSFEAFSQQLYVDVEVLLGHNS